MLNLLATLVEHHKARLVTMFCRLKSDMVFWEFVLEL